jgi:hypothetical protein
LNLGATNASLEVSLGSLVTVVAGPYRGEALTFPVTRGSAVACRLSGQRASDGSVRVVLLTRQPGRLTLSSSQLHPGHTQDTALLGELVVK